MKNIHTLLAGGAALFLCGETHAVIAFTGGTYSENFNALGDSPWINNSTLPGWYASVSQPDGGGVVQPDRPDSQWGPVSSYTGAIYNNTRYNHYGRSIGQTGWRLINLGTSSTAGDRSLGSKSENHDVAFAVALRNETGAFISSVSVSYFGEQWQVNSLASHPSMKLDFMYGVFSSFNGDTMTQPNTVVPGGFYTGYIDPAGGALDFSAIHFDDTTMPLNGHAAANRQALDATLDVNWAPGDYLVLRWFDDYTSSTEQAMLGIDNLQITAIPEP